VLSIGHVLNFHRDLRTVPSYEDHLLCGEIGNRSDKLNRIVREKGAIRALAKAVEPILTDVSVRKCPGNLTSICPLPRSSMFLTLKPSAVVPALD